MKLKFRNHNTLLYAQALRKLNQGCTIFCFSMFNS